MTARFTTSRLGVKWCCYGTASAKYSVLQFDVILHTCWSKWHNKILKVTVGCLFGEQNSSFLRVSGCNFCKCNVSRLCKSTANIVRNAMIKYYVFTNIQDQVSLDRLVCHSSCARCNSGDKAHQPLNSRMWTLDLLLWNVWLLHPLVPSQEQCNNQNLMTDVFFIAKPLLACFSFLLLCPNGKMPRKCVVCIANYFTSRHPVISCPTRFEAEENPLVKFICGILRSLCLDNLMPRLAHSMLYCFKANNLGPPWAKKTSRQYLNQPREIKWSISPGQAPKMPRQLYIPNWTSAKPFLR